MLRGVRTPRARRWSATPIGGWYMSKLQKTFSLGSILLSIAILSVLLLICCTGAPFKLHAYLFSFEEGVVYALKDFYETGHGKHRQQMTCYFEGGTRIRIDLAAGADPPKQQIFGQRPAPRLERTVAVTGDEIGVAGNRRARLLIVFDQDTVSVFDESVNRMIINERIPLRESQVVMDPLGSAPVRILEDVARTILYVSGVDDEGRQQYIEIDLWAVGSARE